MSEHVELDNKLSKLVRDLKLQAQIRVTIGLMTLKCDSSDGKSLYNFAPADAVGYSLGGLTVPDISSIDAWKHIRLSVDTPTTDVKLARYDIGKDEDDKPTLRVARRSVSSRRSFVEQAMDMLAMNNEVGNVTETAPEIQDYQDLAEAINDLKKSTRFEVIIRQLVSMVPCTLDTYSMPDRTGNMNELANFVFDETVFHESDN